MTARALLTESEAAEQLRVCARTLRQARKEGRLTFVLIGRCVRYTMEDLETFIASSRQDTMPAKRATRSTVRRNATIVPFTAR